MTWENNGTNVHTTDLSSDVPPSGRAIWWPRMVLTLVQLHSAHVLLSTIDCLEFSRVLCNSPSSYFIWNPQYLLTPNSPAGPLMPPPQVQASSDQEWYYWRSAWHIIDLWVRVMFCQMYPQPPRELHLVAKSGTNWGLVHLNSCSIVCSTLSWLFKSLLEYTHNFLCNPKCPLTM